MNQFAVRHAEDMTAHRQPRYNAPLKVEKASLRRLVSELPRPALEAAQLDLLDKAKSDPAERATLYMAGHRALLGERCVAVIGARKASSLGRKRARKFARELAERGVVVVSGLAEGIDTEALTSALEAGGRVVAVIGTPLDQAYPAKNKDLQERIYRDHLLVSQFEPGSRVYPSNFPSRNRTMAALSDASVVIEASDTSGTLHQAAECMRLGRWLGISRGVVEDPGLSWPAAFLDKPRCVVLETTDQFLETVYGR
jgi:DNA processing protein